MEPEISGQAEAEMVDHMLPELASFIAWTLEHKDELAIMPVEELTDALREVGARLLRAAYGVD